MEKYPLQVDDIVVARTGATVGYAKIRTRENAVFASHLVRFRINNEIAEPRFIGHLVESDVYKQYVKSQVGGAAQPNANARVLGRFSFALPSRRIQRRIADILSAYDDLIENNRRRIALLEQAAGELYREWFVRLRFPGHEGTKIVDGLPEGWERKTLGEVADITMGQSPKSVHYNETGEGLPFHQGVADFGDRFPAHRTYCSLEDRVAVPGDILFSVRAPVGRINLTLDKIVIGRGIAAIRSWQDRQSYLFCALKNYFFREDMIGGGTIFAAVTRKELHSVRIIQAAPDVVQMFTDRIRSVDSQIEGLHRVAEQLMRARDLLLPRLMSGKVAI